MHSLNTVPQPKRPFGLARIGALFSAAIVAGSLAAAVQAAGADASPPQASAKTTAAAPGKKVSPFRQANPTYKAKQLYQSVWGVDHLSVEQTASGNLIRFKYRVVDPKLARPLNAKEAPAYLINPRNRAMLQIPVMDNVGQLRQTGTPKAGEEYWMTFSNKGNMVKPGDRVTVRIGPFQADGLLVL